jgi:hypothetical protein
VNGLQGRFGAPTIPDQIDRKKLAPIVDNPRLAVQPERDWHTTVPVADQSGGSGRHGGLVAEMGVFRRSPVSPHCAVPGGAFTLTNKGVLGDLVHQHDKGEKVIAATTARPRRGRRATMAGLVLTALAAATVVAMAAPASATATGREMGVRIGSAPTAAARTVAAASALDWIDVYATVSGARVRATPINGTVLRLIPYLSRAFALCRIPANDGFDWTWVSYAGAKGWVRNDLIYPVQFTYPGAPPFHLVPRC